MNRSELIQSFSERNSLPLEEATVFINTFFDCIRQALLDGQRIELRGFGSFTMKKYQSYAGRNPKTGESVTVAAKQLPFFRPGKELKEFINS